MLKFSFPSFTPFFRLVNSQKMNKINYCYIIFVIINAIRQGTNNGLFEEKPSDDEAAAGPGNKKKQ